MIKVLIGIIIYILVGCIIDLLITKGKDKPNIVMALIWPFFLVICAIILAGEKDEKETVKTCEYGDCSDGCQKLKNEGGQHDAK